MDVRDDRKTQYELPKSSKEVSVVVLRLPADHDDNNELK